MTEANILDLPVIEKGKHLEVTVAYDAKCRLRKLRGGFITRNIQATAKFGCYGELDVEAAKRQLEHLLANKYGARRIRWEMFKIVREVEL